ncbi:MAG TPA: type II toxin-antitoxin system HicB family antitoxin [Candidatus Atribacteria bacterium]|nr:type II toxin-antitoxin system HicB family antitoxin [Candidatus Atribacteria bacterium]
MKKLNYKYRILIEKDENGIYIASCPALKGCYSQGDTVEEALQSLKDAIQLILKLAKYLVNSLRLKDL